jgi:hypothetical protein
LDQLGLINGPYAHIKISKISFIDVDMLLEYVEKWLFPNNILYICSRFQNFHNQQLKNGFKNTLSDEKEILCRLVLNNFVKFTNASKNNPHFKQHCRRYSKNQKIEKTSNGN